MLLEANKLIPDDPKMNHLSDEEKMKIRNTLYHGIHQEYIKLITSLQHLPLHEDYFTEVFKHLKTTMLHAKEAILFAPFVLRDIHLDEKKSSSEEVSTTVQ